MLYYNTAMHNITNLIDILQQKDMTTYLPKIEIVCTNLQNRRNQMQINLFKSKFAIIFDLSLWYIFILLMDNIISMFPFPHRNNFICIVQIFSR